MLGPVIISRPHRSHWTNILTRSNTGGLYSGPSGWWWWGRISSQLTPRPRSSILLHSEKTRPPGSPEMVDPSWLLIAELKMKCLEKCQARWGFNYWQLSLRLSASILLRWVVVVWGQTPIQFLLSAIFNNLEAGSKESLILYSTLTPVTWGLLRATRNMITIKDLIMTDWLLGHWLSK